MRKLIGIDLGGTKINGGIVDESGEIIKKITIETNIQDGRKGVLDGIKYIVRELKNKENIEAIGLGTPGFIDVEKGEVVFHGGNIPDWAGVNIREELASEFKDIPTVIENDANVATICEQWVGAGRGLNSFVMVTLGTGVGGGIWTKDEGIWHGNNYQGAEFGHSILYPNGRHCNCGQRGCAEQYISGNGIENSFYEKANKRMRGIDIFKNSEYDPICKMVVEEFADDLAIFLTTLKNIFDPEGIVIGGGVINSKEYWWDKMTSSYEKICNNSKGTKIFPAKYLNDSGMIGAGKLAFDYINMDF